jgi:hypothetical protein
MDDFDFVEQTLYVYREAMIYKIPPLADNRGHRCA